MGAADDDVHWLVILHFVAPNNVHDVVLFLSVVAILGFVPALARIAVHRLYPTHALIALIVLLVDVLLLKIVLVPALNDDLQIFVVHALKQESPHRRCAHCIVKAWMTSSEVTG